MSNVLTIRDAVKRAKADGLPISEYALRQWVRTGVIPTRKAGTKALLFYPNLVRYLQCEADNAPAAVAAGIRKIEL